VKDVRSAIRSGTVERAPVAPEVLQDDDKTLVTIARTSPRDVGQRQVFVRLDDGPRIALVFNEQCTLELRPGRHTLRVHNTLMWRTIDFAVETGEHLEFQLVNHAGWLTLTLLMWLGTGPLYLSIERRSLR
jgi:hypothetical protein